MNHVALVQHRPTALASLCSPERPPLGNAIAHILGVCANPQVRRVDAGWIVAMVTDEHATANAHPGKQRPNVTRAGVSMPPDMARMYDETIAKLHLMPVPTQDERADEISERIEARRGE